ncbi:hypothetical protein TKWG_04515 [Advenella kashmirensis WT001]|uniref:Pyridoxal phosphate homeostasis protein n=1 Tax=Advenella kashmirensis (strain DSM 17095 / LMG 22695 / WT001) TaxID=1036672 RepID=I3U8V0_ADVKW|nr:YggS family pyridoxal phosphate-dependent enzyme [Advenella kashmirensis]AFK61438.1 hypothetical protein TKWG_04515 [Advenella kashmirensis WT001]
MSLAEQFAAVNEQVRLACERAGRDPQQVGILPVSKTFGHEVVRQAMALGQRQFAENRVQEMKEKALALNDSSIEWVVIGYLQTNKVKEVVRYASQLQSLDRLDLAQALDKRLQQAGRRLDVLVQVKSSDEESKTGMAPEQVPQFLKSIRDYDTLNVKGFMTVAENTDVQERIRHCFARVRQLRDQCQNELGDALPVLSMGMSADFELAIQEGSTQLRIGSALFGERPPLR